MRILYLCHRIPYPPNKGDKIRAFHELRALASRHEVDVFTLADEAVDLSTKSGLAGHCHSLTVVPLNPKISRLRALPYLLTRTPLTLPYFYSRELQGEVRSAVSRGGYDRIFVYCSAMAQYVEQVSDIPIVMDFVDVDSDKWTQYAKFTRFPMSAVHRREGRALRRYEQRLCEKAACVVVTTDREAQLVREIHPGARVEVVTNGVDAAYFSPEAIPPDRATPAVIFTGDMAYFPNEEAVVNFAQRVFPLVRLSVPNARFLVVGRNPSPRVQALASAEGVVVTGFVPDVRAYLAQARVAVAPFSIAAGIQNKILEAMAFGLPVVATSKVLQGLRGCIAEVVESADTPSEMAEKIVLLLLASDRASSKGSEGRRLVADNYRWEDALDRLLQLVEAPMRPVAAGPKIRSSVG